MRCAANHSDSSNLSHSILFRHRRLLNSRTIETAYAQIDMLYELIAIVSLHQYIPLPSIADIFAGPPRQSRRGKGVRIPSPSSSFAFNALVQFIDNFTNTISRFTGLPKPLALSLYRKAGTSAPSPTGVSPPFPRKHSSIKRPTMKATTSSCDMTGLLRLKTS